MAARELYAPALTELRGKVEVVACANRTRRKAESFARELGIETVVDDAEQLFQLSEVDAVLLSLPIESQPAYVMKALRSGKPVLSEKPIAPSVSAGRKLVRAARSIAVPWMVGENFAFMDHVAKLKTWIDTGRLGEVRLVQATQVTLMDRKNPYFNTKWRQNPVHRGGFIVDGGVHLANVVRRCFGMPVELKGGTHSFDPKLPPLDTTIAMMRFESGVMGTWTSCFSAQYEGPMLRVLGTRGTAELSWDCASLRNAAGKTTAFKSREGSFVAQFKHFREVVQRGCVPVVTPDEALLDLVFVERLCSLR